MEGRREEYLDVKETETSYPIIQCIDFPHLSGLSSLPYLVAHVFPHDYSRPLWLGPLLLPSCESELQGQEDWRI